MRAGNVGAPGAGDDKAGHVGKGATNQFVDTVAAITEAAIDTVDQCDGGVGNDDVVEPVRNGECVRHEKVPGGE